MKKYYGNYRAKVVSVDDPTNEQRVQLRAMIHSQLTSKGKTDGIPDSELPWAEQASSIFGGFGASKAGISTVPEVDSWVWIFFENGDWSRPIYFASVVSKNDKDVDSDKDDITIVKSKSGHKITINDKSGEENITINEKNSNEVKLDKDGITITDEKGDYVKLLATGGIEINASSGGSIQKMVLGENLSNFIQNTVITTYNTHTHANTYIVPLIPIGASPVVQFPPTQQMANGDYLSNKNKNN